MKNFATAPGSRTCYIEQRSSDHIIADVNDENIDKGQCRHFSIREYVRQMQMRNSMFCSLSYEHINSLLVTTKTYRQWNCKSCRDKLELLCNSTPARTLNESALVPEHAVRKELSQAKGSAKCHSPSSYNKEFTEVDRAINDLYESTLVNQENGSAKYLSSSWGNKESSDANPVVNGLDEASPSNPDGTKKMQSNVGFVDDTNPPDTCQKIKEKKEINEKEKLGFLHVEPMLGRSKKGNCVKSLPVKRKDETHASLHNTDKNMIKTYKRRKSTNFQDFMNDSSFVDCQDRSESKRSGNSKEKHVISIMQPDAGLLRPVACLSEENIHTTNIMDGDESIQNNGVYQTPCCSLNELEFSKMYLSKVSPGKSDHTHRKTTEDEEDECISVKEASTKVQSEKSNPEFSQLEQQQSQHLHNEVSLGNATEDEQDDCAITSVKDVSTRLQSGESHNQYNGENFTSYIDNISLNESFPPTMDISAKYQHPENFSNPSRPVPRIGVLSLTLQKDVTTYSESCGSQSGYRLGMSEEETPCQKYRGENLALLSSQQFPANCSPQHLGYATSVAIPEPERGSSHSTKGKSKIVDPSDKSSEQESVLCLCLSLCCHECCTSWKEFQITR